MFSQPTTNFLILTSFHTTFPNASQLCKHPILLQFELCSQSFVYIVKNNKAKTWLQENKTFTDNASFSLKAALQLILLHAFPHNIVKPRTCLWFVIIIIKHQQHYSRQSIQTVLSWYASEDNCVF